MACQEVQQKIDSFFAGLLDREEEGMVGEHLDSCEECTRYREETGRLGDLLREYVKEEVDLIPENVILGRVEAEIREIEEGGRGWFLGNLKYLVPAFAGALALIAILFYPSIMRYEKDPARSFAATVESVEAENATVMIVDRGRNNPKVIWIIEREDI